MYPSLFELGLTKYIERVCGGIVSQDKYFTRLEKFVSNLSKKSFTILKEKFKGNIQNREISDLLNEINIALIFHPKATFNKDGPDLTDNDISIEIKTLNECENEIKRHDVNNFSTVSPRLGENEIIEERRLTFDAVKRKVRYHLDKANRQLSGRGLVYLIWDYNGLCHGEDKHVHSNVANEIQIEDCINTEIKCFSEIHLGLSIKSYYFREVLEMVSRG